MGPGEFPSWEFFWPNAQWDIESWKLTQRESYEAAKHFWSAFVDAFVGAGPLLDQYVNYFDNLVSNGLLLPSVEDEEDFFDVYMYFWSFSSEEYRLPNDLEDVDLGVFISVIQYYGSVN